MAENDPFVTGHWPDHPKHTPYRGTSNTASKNTDVDRPESFVSRVFSRFSQGLSSNSLQHHVPDHLGFESFLLGDDEKKIEEKLDTRTPNTSIFKLNKEDHTLGNLLREKTLSNSHVVFSAYKVPHPLFPTFDLRVQTDGEITPREAVVAACRDLVRELSILDQNFTKEYELRKMVGQAHNGQ